MRTVLSVVLLLFLSSGCIFNGSHRRDRSEIVVPGIVDVEPEEAIIEVPGVFDPTEVDKETLKPAEIMVEVGADREEKINVELMGKTLKKLDDRLNEELKKSAETSVEPVTEASMTPIKIKEKVVSKQPEEENLFPIIICVLIGLAVLAYELWPYKKGS